MLGTIGRAVSFGIHVQNQCRILEGMMKTRSTAQVALFIFLLMALMACGRSDLTDSGLETSGTAVTEPATTVGESVGGGSEADSGSPYVSDGGPKAAPTPSASEGWVDVSGADGSTADRAGVAAPASESTAAAVVVESEAMEGMVAEAPASAPSEPEIAPVDKADSVASGEPATSGSGLTLDQASRLSAGDVDDNVQWDDYLLYRRNYSGARVLDVDISERHQIFVRDSAGNPVLGAVIRLSNEAGSEVMTLRTHSDGRAYFFPSVLPRDEQSETYTAAVTVNNATETFTLGDPSQREWTFTHPAVDQLQPKARLDVLFLIDATGSMADEIQQLKDNIQAIAARIDAMPTRPDVRFAMTVYRDRGDEYVTRTFEFTPDVDFFATGLAEVTADGGGDYPEDLNEGLYKAIHVPEWRVEETVSLIFLVADAPPHLDYGDQASDYATEMQEAAARGIKIYPIASSGLDAQGEYIFRQLAQYTGGRFLFLTYGAGGAGTTGGETEFSVEGYDVTSLDGLVIKIIEEELAPLTR